MTNLSTSFPTVLQAALNGQLLLFQHAHPGIAVAEMKPREALDWVLAPEQGSFPQERERYEAARGFLEKVGQGVAEKARPEIVSQALAPIGQRVTEVMIEGVLRVFDEPLGQVLETFKITEPIRKRLGDKAAWSVYSDWLSERGDPRGELIVIDQASSGVTDEAVLERFRARKAELEKKLEREYQGPPTSLKVHWRRGYFERVHLERANGNVLRRVFSWEEARFLTHLSLGVENGRIMPLGLQDFLDTPQLRSILDLRLAPNHIGDAGASLLADCRYLEPLLGLDVTGNEIGPRGAAALGQSPYLRSLRRLIFDSNLLETDGTRALVGSSNLSSLQELSLGSNGIDGEGARAISISPHLASLRQLRLTLNVIGDSGAWILAQSPHLESLEGLALGANIIGEEGAIALLRSTRLRSLRVLNLRSNPIDVESHPFLQDLARERGIELRI
jgi:uncharacterized protein (TIGR02996 family)